VGHTRLGELPKTRNWNQVIRLLGTHEAEQGLTTSDVSKLAAKTVTAARVGLDRAIDDPGVHHTFFVLTQLAIAGRSENWAESLNRLGVNAAGAANVFELSGGVQDAIEAQLRNKSSDLSEVAQKAAGDALIELGKAQTPSLFGNEAEDVANVVKQLSSKTGFSDLGHKFFSRFISRFLNSYLSRATASQLGRSKLTQIGDISQFDSALQLHCDQTARIVRDFCGEWFSKTEYLEGITPENTRRFFAVAIKKLQAELKRQKAGK
jgi:hypothetical protein